MPEGKRPPVPAFTYDKSEFYNTLKARMRAHFNGASHKAPVSKVIRVTILVCSFFGLLPHFWSGAWWTLPCLGMLSFILGTLFLHDATHCALSKNPYVNRACALFTTIFGSMHPICWVHTHVIGHHLYPNVEGFDLDARYAEHGGLRIRPLLFRYILMNSLAIVWPSFVESYKFRKHKSWPKNGTKGEVYELLELQDNIERVHWIAGDIGRLLYLTFFWVLPIYNLGLLQGIR